MIRATSIEWNDPGAAARFDGAAYPDAADRPVISVLTKISLLGYLVSLALTQSAYGGAFMNLRWITLAMLAGSSGADIILLSRRRTLASGLDNGKALVIYLLLTLGTVVYAENWLFSGMRWASHAAMLVIFILVLPQILASGQIQSILSVLRLLMGIMVLVSWVFPAPVTVEGNGAFYQGAMGNANTLGHIACITALLSLHAFITSRIPRIRFCYAALAVIAMSTIWKSGARSSMTAILVGILLLCYFYRKEMRGIALVGTLIAGLAMVSFPTLPQRMFLFAQKSSVYARDRAFNPMESRVPVWTAAYEGFKERPLLGWGFGADSKISKKWEVKLTSLGTVERDAVNDFLFMMEGCGIVGLGSYLLLIWIVWKQRPGTRQAAMLRNWTRDQEADAAGLPEQHTHTVMFIIAVCLLVLNQFDNTALSAGNLISVTLWLCAGCAASLRRRIGRCMTP